MYKNSIAIALVAAVVSAQGKSGKSIDKRQDNQDGNGNGNAYGRDPDFKTWAAKNNRHFKNTAEMTKREKNFAAST